MDENGDSNEQFHRNEAISAIVNDGFLSEKDDEYEVEPLLPVPPTSLQVATEVVAFILAVAGNRGGGEKFFQKDNDGEVERSQNVGFRVNAMVGRGSGRGGSGAPVDGGLRVELGQSSSKVAELGEQFVNNSVTNQGILLSNQGIMQQSHAPGTGLVANTVNVGNAGNDGLMRQGSGNMNGAGGNGFGNGTGPSTGGVERGGGGIGIKGGGGGGGTNLLVGDLH